MFAVLTLAVTLTRLPPGAPLVTPANAHIFKDIIGALVLLYLAGLAFQVWWPRSLATGPKRPHI